MNFLQALVGEQWRWVVSGLQWESKNHTKKDYFILKFTGRSMNSTEVYDSLKNILENKAEKREILTHGA